MPESLVPSALQAIPALRRINPRLQPLLLAEVRTGRLRRRAINSMVLAAQRRIQFAGLAVKVRRTLFAGRDPALRMLGNTQQPRATWKLSGDMATLSRRVLRPRSAGMAS